jgi:hypothetical protein
MFKKQSEDGFIADVLKSNKIWLVGRDDEFEKI